MTIALYAFDEVAGPADQLAKLLGITRRSISVHHFPDGETLVSVPTPLDATTIIVYRSLDNPNAKLVELLFAQSALRENGANKVILVAPYLAYLRQDKEFHHGEAVSRDVICGLIEDHFDALMTIDPHLHRLHDLGQAMTDIEVVSLSAASILAAGINPLPRPILVGPDSESRQWVEAIARSLGLDILIGEKVRRGDQEVKITIPGVASVQGRPVVLVDDVISSGGTLEAAANLVKSAGASHIEALVTHCLASKEVIRRLELAGIERIRSTDAVPGPTACLSVAPILANAIADRFSLDELGAA